MHFCFCYPTWPEHRLVICCVNKQVHPECYFPCSVADAPMQTVGRSKWIFRNYFFLSWSVDYILILYQHYSSLHNSILLKITESWSSGQGVGCNSSSSVLSNISSQICPVIGRKKTPKPPLAASRVCSLVIKGTRRPAAALWKHGSGLEI